MKWTRADWKLKRGSVHNQLWIDLLLLPINHPKLYDLLKIKVQRRGSFWNILRWQECVWGWQIDRSAAAILFNGQDAKNWNSNLSEIFNHHLPTKFTNSIVLVHQLYICTIELPDNVRISTTTIDNMQNNLFASRNGINMLYCKSYITVECLKKNLYETLRNGNDITIEKGGTFVPQFGHIYSQW